MLALLLNFTALLLRFANEAKEEGNSCNPKVGQSDPFLSRVRVLA